MRTEVGKTDTERERFYTLSEVARRLEVSDQSVRRWVKAGELKAYKPKKEYRIAESDLREFLEERQAGPLGSATPLQDPLFKGESEGRRADATVREGVHLKDYVRTCLDRWEQVARGEDPHLAPDHEYSIEVYQQVIALNEWLGKLLRAVKAELPPEVAATEQREIVELIDRMGAVAAEIGAIANAAEGITAEAVDEEFQALVDAEVRAHIANRNPGDRLAEQRANKAQRVYEARSEAQRSAAKAKKRPAVGE